MRYIEKPTESHTGGFTFDTLIISNFLEKANNLHRKCKENLIITKQYNLFSHVSDLQKSYDKYREIKHNL